MLHFAQLIPQVAMPAGEANATVVEDGKGSVGVLHVVPKAIYPVVCVPISPSHSIQTPNFPIFEHPGYFVAEVLKHFDSS